MDVTYRLYIDGEWVDSTGDEVLVVENPATEEPIGAVPQATTDDVKRAIQAARRAFDEGPWPTMSPRERSAVMLRMADALERRRPQLIDLAIREAGTIRSAAEVMQVGIALEHFVDTADRVLNGFAFEVPMLPNVGRRGVGQGMIVREAFGVASLISAYNFPLFLNLGKIGSALAAGCTAILKPSPFTPLMALILGEVADEAELPPGVLNIVTGDVAAGEALTTDPMVDIVSFTGSDVVGRKVYAQAAPTLKKVVLELGGKSANIILEDADLSRVVPNVLTGFTTHAGQGCNLLTRTLVHESLRDELVERVVAAAANMVIGDPAEPGTTLGPVISAAQRAKVESLLAAGLNEGATVAVGGGRPSHLDKGYFLEPTLLVDVDNRMQVAQQEFFGPVGVVITFKDEAEAVRLANDSDYGLNGSVWSADAVKAMGIARRLRTGTASINGGGGGASPFSAYGGYKQSGLGREWGEYGMAEFLQYKTLTWSVGR